MVSLRAAVFQAADRVFREFPGWTMKTSQNGHAWHFLLYSFKGCMLHFPSSKHLCNTHLIQYVFKRLTPVMLQLIQGFPWRLHPFFQQTPKSEQSQHRSCQCHLSKTHPLACSGSHHHWQWINGIPWFLLKINPHCWRIPQPRGAVLKHHAQVHCWTGLDLGSLVL